jgi:hypothetical protein
MAVERGGKEVSDDMLTARDAARTGEISPAEYKEATEGYHQEADTLFTANRAEQDAQHPEWAKREPETAADRRAEREADRWGKGAEREAG